MMAERFHNPLTDAQRKLLQFVKCNKLDAIKELIIKEGTTILNLEYPSPCCKPILHFACGDFAKTTDAETVKALIGLEADIRKSSSLDQKEAIHAAVWGKNPDILEVILQEINNDPEKLNATAQGNNTALNLLVRGDEVDTKNFNRCLELLLESAIDVNKADGKGYTPILWAAYKGYENVVEAIIRYGKNVDLDTHKLRGKNARTYIEEQQLYPLLPKKDDCNDTNSMSPIALIINNKEPEFLQLETPKIDPQEETEEGTILQFACKKKMNKAVQRLLKLGAGVNKTTLKNEDTPLKIAANRGYHQIFQLLIELYDTCFEGILTTLLKNINSFQHSKTDYEKCLNILLEQEGLDFNEYSDTQNTPLHYSSGLSDPTITLRLLDKGASLANENKYNILPIEDIDTGTLEEHFDKCITGNNRVTSDRQNIVVKFDYKSLFPVSPENVKNYNDQRETGVVHVMSKIPEMHHLLIHPLIASFIDVKWHRMRWFFRTNLILFLTFCVTFVAYVFVPDNEDEQEQYWHIRFTFPILVASYVVLILREGVQLLLSFRTYCCSITNFLEVTMLVVCFYPIFFKSPNILYKQLSSTAMVIIALELMILLGQHPTWSINIVTLRTVAKNFFSFLLWYAVLIVAFVLCFYKLFSNDGDGDARSNKTTENITKNGSSFDDLSLTFIKTIVMLTGELNASDINFDNVWNKLIFLLFVFMIPIILLNLLNSLAISDTQQIRNDAEIIGYRERINYIVYLENIILGKITPKTLNDCSFHGYSYIGLRRYIIKKVCLKDYLSEKCMEVKLYEGSIILNRNRKKAEPEVKQQVVVQIPPPQAESQEEQQKEPLVEPQVEAQVEFFSFCGINSTLERVKNFFHRKYFDLYPVKVNSKTLERTKSILHKRNSGA